jgi:predicted amidohydrolase
MKTGRVQMDVLLGDVEANRVKAGRLMAQGIALGAEQFVFPELWTTGYQLPGIEALAETEGGQTASLLRRIASPLSSRMGCLPVQDLKEIFRRTDLSAF